MGMVVQFVMLAQEIAANAPLSLAGMKKVLLRVNTYMDHVEHEDLDEMVTQNRLTADAQEGIRAQLEKRPPVFRGE